MPIKTLLDLPDPQLEHADIKLLEAYPAKDRPSGMALIAYPHGNGWSVSTYGMRDAQDREQFVAAVRKEGFSDKFVSLLDLAKQNDVDLIRLNGPEGPRAKRTILDLSTGHITSRDAEILGGYPADDVLRDRPLVAHPYEYGFTVTTDPLNDPDQAVRTAFVDAVRAEGFSDAFVRLLETAAERGACMVRLDQDADPEDNLDFHDWEAGDVVVDPDTMEPVGQTPSP